MINITACILHITISSDMIFVLVSRYLSLWTSLELAFIGGICVSQTHRTGVILDCLRLCAARNYFSSESYGPWASYYLWKQTFSWYNILYFQSVIFDEIELTDLSVAECSTKNINHSFQVSAFGGVDSMMKIFLLTCTISV